MDGLQAILDRILEEANAKVAGIQAETDNRIADIRAQNDSAIRSIGDQQEQRTAAQTRALTAHRESQASLERRRILLLARQEMVDQALVRALELVRDLPRQVKVAFYARLLRQSVLTSGEVILNPADQALAGELLETGRLSDDRQYTLSTEPGSFAAGLLIRRGPVIDNQTVELMIKNRRGELVRAAADVLFPESAERHGSAGQPGSTGQMDTVKDSGATKQRGAGESNRS